MSIYIVDVEKKKRKEKGEAGLSVRLKIIAIVTGSMDISPSGSPSFRANAIATGKTLWTDFTISG